MLRELFRNLGQTKRNPAEGHSSPGQPPAVAARPIYFAGIASFQFGVFGPRIMGARLDLIKGVISDTYARQAPTMSVGPYQNVPTVKLEDFRNIAAKGAVEVVHFCGDLDQYWGLEAIAACGPNVTIVDFLTKLYDFNLPHTYKKMLDEQAWWEQHQSDLERIAGCFGDHHSHLTLAARFEAIMSAKRRPLVEVSMPAEYEYYNTNSRYASLVPGDEEIYVDVGAAHGDTVDRFRQVTQGKYRQILAFEPTPGQYRALATRELGDQRVKTFPYAVGETAGSMTFYNNEANPFGSNALAGNGDPIQVQCVRLDDVVEHCTLLKMDVEGFECNVLRGSRRLIRESRPDMAITCYHYPQDLSEILALVLDTHAYRHVALRHYSPCLYDSILLFSDRQSFGA